MLEAPAASGGRFFYSNDYQGFNFARKVAEFDEFVDRLLAIRGQSGAPALSIQSAFLDEYFDGLNSEHKVNLFGDDVRPRIWIGNRTVVATHNDDAENVACVAAGRRRFTLFPPGQLPNLYMGPLNKTPAGTPVSLASLTPPDLKRFPKLREALDHSYVAELDPGDAIYIPTLWWHHVEALSDFNILINFWRGGAIAGEKGVTPQDALLLACLTIKSLPAKQRDAWKSFFDHYIFGVNGDPSVHIPEELRGILGDIGSDDAQALKKWLIKQLSV
ncbi:cupin-like domain-containing protein [Microbulbifer agarilyticus]